MLNENAKEWVAALKTDEFDQTDGMLCKPGIGFCCMGVACELFHRKFPDQLPKSVEAEYTVYGSDTALLPDIVKNWLGLRTEGGDFWLEGKPFGRKSLVGLNDAGVKFVDIATLIETEPEGLFVETTDAQLQRSSGET